MKIEKRNNGSYRVRKMYKGKIYTVTFNYKPTQKEVMQAMAAEMDKVKETCKSMTFHVAAEEYIASKRNVLSPTTIRGYNSAMKTISKKFREINVHDITALDIQTEINQLSKDHSPKTVRNYHGFISAVLGTFRPNLKFAPPCHKRSRMSLISPLMRTLNVCLNMQKIRNMKSQLFWRATGSADQRYVRSHWTILTGT